MRYVVRLIPTSSPWRSKAEDMPWGIIDTDPPLTELSLYDPKLGFLDSREATEAEAVAACEKKNTEWATYLMTQGTAAEREHFP